MSQSESHAASELWVEVDGVAMDLASPGRGQPDRAKYFPLKLYVHVVVILGEGCQSQHLPTLTTSQNQVRRINLNRDYRVIFLLCHHQLLLFHLIRLRWATFFVSLWLLLIFKD